MRKALPWAAGKPGRPTQALGQALQRRHKAGHKPKHKLGHKPRHKLGHKPGHRFIHRALAWPTQRCALARPGRWEHPAGFTHRARV